MTPPNEDLGLLKPMGGGDPIPLRRPEMTIGRRPSCDIRLPFENISGKHCQLKLIGGVWHVRDLGSTNKTTVNGLSLSTDHAVLPEDELGIAGHLYTIEYEPRGSAILMNNNQILEDELGETHKRHSLMELAGLEDDDDDDRPRATRAPERIVRPSAEEADFEDALPRHAVAAPAPLIEASEDEFLKLIEEDVKDVKKDKG